MVKRRVTRIRCPRRSRACAGLFVQLAAGVAQSAYCAQRTDNS
jgi:hypothetical protein